MNSFFSSIGRMVILSLILPGTAGFLYLLLLSPFLLHQEIRLDIYHISLYIFGLGFIADVIGHAIDEIFRVDSNCYHKFIYLANNNNVKSEIIGPFFNELDYLNSLRNLYWNSGTIIILLLIYKISTILLSKYSSRIIYTNFNNNLSYYIIIFIVTIVILFALFYLCKHLKRHIDGLLNSLNDNIIIIKN